LVEFLLQTVIIREQAFAQSKLFPEMQFYSVSLFRCILEETYNLGSTSSPARPVKIPALPSPSTYVVTNHAETPTSTPILDFFNLKNDSISTPNGPTTYLPVAEESQVRFKWPLIDTCVARKFFYLCG
jgi:hypothetical protein